MHLLPHYRGGVMFPRFFKHKMREVASFLKIMKGKVTQDDSQRVEGAKKALNAMKDERKVYEQEIKDAYQGVDPDTKRYQADAKDKVLRESGGQDITAI